MKYVVVALIFLLSSCANIPSKKYTYNVSEKDQFIPVEYEINPISNGSITTSNIRTITSEIEKSGYFSKLESSSLDSSLINFDIKYKRLAGDGFLEKCSIYFSAFTLFTIPAYEKVQHWMTVTVSNNGDILFEKEYYVSTDVYISLWNMASIRTEQGLLDVLDQMYKDLRDGNFIPQVKNFAK